jgi:hexosaminidase
VRQRGNENTGGSTGDLSGPNHAFKPGFAFDAGIRPLKDLAIKGIIWYQGESNAQETERVQEYAALQELLVRDLRNNWNETALPFYYVQLSSIDSVKYRSKLWPMFRDEQRKFMDKVPHTGMAVSHDHGAMNDVHPRNKKVIGERLSQWALKFDYGQEVIPSGPLPTHALQENSSVRIFFNYASTLVTANGDLKGFSIDGIHETMAMIEDSTVVIPNAGNAKWIYYGWKPFTDANLVNSDGLPAPGFRIPVSAVPALIPLPKQLQWGHQRFDLNQCRNIRISGSDMETTALLFKQLMADKGINLTLAPGISQTPFVLFRVDPSVRNKEGYRISVKRDSIVVSASTSKGAFYALQTMLQLTEGSYVWGCEIEDWPAFPWRGYMVDVGRNFQSIRLLKQQIDIMSKYKLNIFHFHLTEDVAWRVEIPGFSQLTKAETMIRNKGSYYSVEEMKDLISYCRERNITMVPEIDMPGHSEAFKRAMGVDMQSKEGKAIMKKILKIFCDTYDLEYIHIGGDEVKITDTSFLPEMIRYLKSRNKKVIGWDPGGNLGNDVIRQLWMTEGPKDPAIKYIDSRHLYLNHMDPLESVTTIFHRKIGDTDSANANVQGATVCLWHDRNVRNEADLLIMNPVYPAMLAFAEKSWRGGGHPYWITNTINPKAFGEFEARMLQHKQRTFKYLPFPYWKQSDINWKLYGPFNNEGNLSRNFAPDTTLLGIAPFKTVVGGTIVLRHFWDPAVVGVIPNARDNTTWYATTEIWSDGDTTASFRIGFNNFSRSYVTDSPAEGAWNNLQSKIFINGLEVAPPKWKQAGAKGQLELPLIDEGYEYREPHRIPMKKGWNKVLVKLPVGSFKGPGFGNPVKWMFTVVKDE